MNFAHPLALLLLLLLIPVALLYWLRVRVPIQSIGTGLFWRKALADETFRQRWQRWRAIVSVVLQMLIVVLLALAAAGPQFPPTKRFVLVIDNSATMRATDVEPSRIDRAKEVARRFIESLRSYDEAALVTVCPAPMEIQPTTSDHGHLQAAINSIEAGPEPAKLDSAVKLARKISTVDKVPPEILLITDACSRDATKQAEEGGVKVLRVGTAAGNLAITRFAGRRSITEPVKFEVLVELRNQGDQPANGSVTLFLDSKTGPSAPFAMAKDGRSQHVFTIEIPAKGHLTAKIEPGDAYSFDDTAELDVPADPAVNLVKFADEGQTNLKETLETNSRVISAQDQDELAAADIRAASDAKALTWEKPWPLLWIGLAGFAAALVVLEWCLYQRRWTC